MVLLSYKNRLLTRLVSQTKQDLTNILFYCINANVASKQACLREVFDDHLSDYPFLVGVKTICPPADSSLVGSYWKSFIYG